MALLPKATSGNLISMGIGAGAVLALRFVGPVVMAVARPLTKALIVRSMDGFEILAGKVAATAESFQDMVAEARAERSLAARTPSTSPAESVREVN